MAETDTHRTEMMALLFALEELFREDEQVYVAGNLLLYYEEGNPHAALAPDVFVIFGIPRRERRIYKLWEEGKAPDVVIELTSKSTRSEDLSDKRWRYEEMGVKEYFLFDPLAEYLRPKLQGFRLEGQFYMPLVPQPLPGEGWRLISQTLGLELHSEGSRLRLFDQQRGEYLPTPHEEAEARRAAEEQTRYESEARRAAEQRAQALENELTRLQSELARLRGGN